MTHFFDSLALANERIVPQIQRGRRLNSSIRGFSESAGGVIENGAVAKQREVPGSSLDESCDGR